MSDDLLARMRALRRRADLLTDRIIDDYRPFLNPHDKATFYRLPTKPPTDSKDIGVTPTATALMALCLADRLSAFYETKTSDELVKKLTAVVQALLEQHWTTASLEQNNAFTTAMVLRSAATLVSEKHVDSSVLRSMRRSPLKERIRDNVNSRWIDGPKIPPGSARSLGNKSLTEICEVLIRHAPEGLSVQRYPPTATIAYWVFDAASMVDHEVSKSDARRVIGWAVKNFWRSVSLVTANDHALMDPIDMAMAACLCRVLKRISRSQQALRKAMIGSAPTNNELLSAVRLFFQRQNDAGVWEKYFALFHYPSAGANHCWHFEVLEAVLHEFPELLREVKILERFDLSVAWLESNRLEYRHKGQVFRGWDSGGDPAALRNGEPESWPAGVAYMCCIQLPGQLTEALAG